MAINQMNMSAGSRSKGCIALTRSKYNAREAQWEKRNDLGLHEEGNLPSWAKSASDYWAAADEYERANGCLYREQWGAIPRELSVEAQKALAREQALAVCGNRLPYQLDVHDLGGKNPHFHLMHSERGLDGHDRTPDRWFRRANKQHPERGGAAKDATLKTKARLYEERENWVARCNQALERNGLEERVVMGKERVQGEHLGVAAAARERRQAQRLGLETEGRDLDDIVKALGNRGKLATRKGQEHFEALRAREKAEAITRELKELNKELAQETGAQRRRMEHGTSLTRSDSVSSINRRSETQRLRSMCTRTVATGRHARGHENRGILQGTTDVYGQHRDEMRSSDNVRKTGGTREQRELITPPATDRDRRIYGEAAVKTCRPIAERAAERAGVYERQAYNNGIRLREIEEMGRIKRTLHAGERATLERQAENCRNIAKKLRAAESRMKRPEGALEYAKRCKPEQLASEIKQAYGRYGQSRGRESFQQYKKCSQAQTRKKGPKRGPGHDMGGLGM